MRILLAIALSLILTTTAYAAPVTFQFAGTINQAPISGSYTFESTAPINDIFFRNPGRVTYFDIGHFLSPPPLDQEHRTSAADSILAATVNWNGQTATYNPAFPIDQPWAHNYGSSGIIAREGLGIDYSHNDALYGAVIHVQGLTGYDWFGLAVEGPGLITSNIQLPTMPPSLNGVPAPLARVELFNWTTGAFVQGQLTSLTAVPIPPSVWLFGAGLLVLVGLRWRPSHAR